MANSRYEYVKLYELDDRVPCTWIVVKIKIFQLARFAEIHEFQKPNDGRFSQLMNKTTVSLLKEYPDIDFAYGVNDEYSFVFKKATQFHKRRASKIVSVVVSFFAASFNMLWNSLFLVEKLKCRPSFSGRVFFCPSAEGLRDYMSWRQVNGFVKNCSPRLLLKSGKIIKDAPDLLLDFSSRSTVELLPGQSGRGYSMSCLSEIGSCVYKRKAKVDRDARRRSQNEVIIDQYDMTSSKFWKEHENIFGKTCHDESGDTVLENLDQCLEKMKKFKCAKVYENEDTLMPCAWVVVRIDGCHFHRFSHVHQFEKPNDQQALKLMNICAASVVEEFPDVVFSYGVSDEYSFIFKNTTKLYNRRSSKIISHVVSVFSSMYVLKWKEFFPTKSLKYPPSFDGRAVCYPSDVILYDYMAWRQVDCHINNHYNKCFWMLVKSGKSKSEAQHMLKGTQANEKNEILRQFGINYELEPDLFKKGSCVLRKDGLDYSQTKGGQYMSFDPQNTLVKHWNIIDSSFWETYPDILGASKDPLSTLGNAFTFDFQSFEIKHKLMPSTWVIVKIKFCNFERFSELYDFEKPNDVIGLNVMNACAIALQKEFKDVVLSYGFNDEYSFVFKKDTPLEERCSRIKLSVSLFFSHTYLSKWKVFFPFKDLKEMPTFSATIYCCPSLRTLQGYLAWRQEECHIYNLYQTCLWMLVKSGENINEVKALLKDSSVGDKNEMLFQRCHFNYNTCSPILRKGSCTFRYKINSIEKLSECNHCDITRPSFWSSLSKVFDEGRTSYSEKSEFVEKMESFEVKDSLLPSTWVAFMVDLRFVCRCPESNDKPLLDLIHASAVAVFEESLDTLFLYISEGEFGFVFKMKKLHEKSFSDMNLSIAFSFCNAYFNKRPNYFPEQEIGELPALDWRTYCFPTAAILLDFLALKESYVNRSSDYCFSLLVKSEDTEGKATYPEVKKLAQMEEPGRMNEGLKWKKFSNVLDFQIAYPDLLKD